MIKQIDSKTVKTDFLKIEDKGKLNPKAKTHVFHVTRLDNGIMLGYIQWYNHWRQYAFFPYNCILEPICLKDISDFLTEITDKQKKKWY